MPTIKTHKHLLKELDILMEEALHFDDGTYEMLLQELENLKHVIAGDL